MALTKQAEEKRRMDHPATYVRTDDPKGHPIINDINETVIFPRETAGELREALKGIPDDAVIALPTGDAWGGTLYADFDGKSVRL